MKAAFSLLAYLVFNAVFLYFIGFVGNLLVPRSLDAGSTMSLPVALFVDCGWFVVFAVQHSAMARPSFKRQWTRIIPPGAERSAYVLASSLMLALLFFVWQPIPIVVWRLGGVAFYAMSALSVAGWLLAVGSTYAIDHFELFGLRASRAKEPELKTPALYRCVRHPLYLGFVIAFWAAPLMTVGHLVFAMGMTSYVLIGIHFEERDLVRTFGDRYLEYRRRVPALLPWPRP